MRFQTMGDKPGLGIEQIRSAETTITIKKGAPVFLQLGTTEPGLRAISVEGLANAVHATFFGLALTDIAPGALGESVLYGYYAYSRWIQSTRAASTDVWASYSAGVVGDVAGFRTTVGDQCLTRSVAAAATAFMPAIILAETYASQTTQASSLGGTSTVSISTLKVFLRAI